MVFETTSGNIDKLTWSYNAEKRVCRGIWKIHILDPTISTNNVAHQEKVFVIS
ncbi:MAG: hypothetical protein ACYC2U_06670 [Candidatus Amoebophilus sp.]